MLQYSIYTYVRVFYNNEVRMISMSGYGKGIAEINGKKLTIELKSVNHRFLDLNIKMPRILNAFEETVKNQIKSIIARGHIDVFVNYAIESNQSFELKCDYNLIEKYLNIASELAVKYDIVNDITVSELFRVKDAIVETEVEENEEEIRSLIEVALTNACTNLINMRTCEGEKIKQNLIEKVEYLKDIVAKIAEYAPIQVQNYHDKLLIRIQEGLGDIAVDQAKLMNEIVFYADKVSTDEEFTRLYAHIEHFKEICMQDGAIGRKLDFIVQEMNRESNTIGSKCSDLGITNYVVALKTEIEKIREQIQNIE